MSDDSRYYDDAYLEGRILRLENDQRKYDSRLNKIENEQKAIRHVHGELADEIEKLNATLRRLREENENNPWRENTEVRNHRREELDSLRVRAKDAERAEVELLNQRAKFTRQLVLLVPSFGAVLYALAELIRGLLVHPH